MSLPCHPRTPAVLTLALFWPPLAVAKLCFLPFPVLLILSVRPDGLLLSVTEVPRPPQSCGGTFCGSSARGLRCSLDTRPVMQVTGGVWLGGQPGKHFARCMCPKETFSVTAKRSETTLQKKRLKIRKVS